MGIPISLDNSVFPNIVQFQLSRAREMRRNEEIRNFRIFYVSTLTRARDETSFPAKAGKENGDATLTRARDETLFLFSRLYYYLVATLTRARNETSYCYSACIQ